MRLGTSSDREVKSGREAPPPVNRWLVAACVVQFLLLAALGFHWLRTRPAVGPPGTLSSEAGVKPKVGEEDQNYSLGKPGPWGRLRTLRVVIELPDMFYASRAEMIHPTRWFFADYTPDRLKVLLTGIPLSPEARAELLDSQRWQVMPNGIVLTPTPASILGLTAEARRSIYTVLGANPANDYQFLPYTFPPDGLEEWLRGPGLSAETQTLIRGLVYRRGASLCFSDLPEVFNRAGSDTEKKRLLKTLGRQPSLLVKLHIEPGSDIDSLVAYWGVGGRAKDLTSLLEALTRVPGSARVDIAHLLPAFARKRIYTYAPIPTSLEGTGPDCFWTVRNFFNDPPDETMSNEEFVFREIPKNYFPIPGQPALGDLVFLLKPDGTPLHAAVYIADDVVFTKNGMAYQQPWLFMTMAELSASYPSETPPRVIIYRRKT